MTCKDCIHCEACERMISDTSKMFKALLSEILKMNCDIKYDSTNILSGAEICQCFQDRSRFVELPCKVGDILYHPVPLRNMIAEYKIKSFQIYPRVWVNWNIVDGVATINMPGIYAKEIGKTVFLTREEAERALKERGENEK